MTFYTDNPPYLDQHQDHSHFIIKHLLYQQRGLSSWISRISISSVKTENTSTKIENTRPLVLFKKAGYGLETMDCIVKSILQLRGRGPEEMI